MLHVKLNAAQTRFVAIGGHSDGGDRINELVSSWPGWSRVRVARRAVGSTYAGPCSMASALALDSTTLPLSWEESARARAGDLLQRFHKARAILEDERTRPAMVTTTERAPKPYQARGVRAMELLGARCWLSDDMGLGKTSQVLWLAQRLKVTRLLVVCPASVKFKWGKEVAATLGATWPTMVIDGTAPQRASCFADLDAIWKEYGRLVITINYDLLPRLPEANQMERLRRFVEGQMVVLDEGHYCKNLNSARTAAVVDNFCPPNGGAKHRVIVTGTPIRNTVEDVYALAEIVQPGTFFSKTWFLNKFTEQSTITVGKKRKIKKKVVRRAKNTKELNVIVNTLQVRREMDKVGNLPPKTFSYPELELDPQSAKVYGAMRDFALLCLDKVKDDERLNVPKLSPTVRTAVEAAARCEQLSQGCVGGVPESVMSRVSSVITSHAVGVAGKPGWLVFPKHSKLVWLQEQLDKVAEVDQRAVVFSQFNAPLLWLAAQRNGKAVHGSIKAADREEIFTEFQAGAIQDLYVQVKIAEGFDLFRARYEFFLGRDWAPAVNKQAIARCHRIGQTGTVSIYIPISRNTIEVRQAKALAAKEADAASVLCYQTVADLREALE